MTYKGGDLLEPCLSYDISPKQGRSQQKPSGKNLQSVTAYAYTIKSSVEGGKKKYKNIINDTYEPSLVQTEGRQVATQKNDPRRYYKVNNHNVSWLKTLKNVVRKFDKLVAVWEKDTLLFSSTKSIVNHPAYQEIISMGELVIPLILARLRQQPDHWFHALKTISGEDPVNPEDRGNLPKMAKAWLTWGSKHDYV